MKDPESSTLHQIAGAITLGEPVIAGEIAVLPLFVHPAVGGPVEEEPEPYLLLDEAIKGGLVEVIEIGQGRVPEILVRNRGASPILILEGDHLIGAKQNRAVWITILVPPKSETVIPVSCLERGRWHYNEGAQPGPGGTARGGESVCGRFSPHRAKVSPSMRAAAFREISLSLKRGHGFSVNQGRVWNDVDNLVEGLSVTSPSRAYADAAESRQNTIEEMLPRFRPAPGQAGVMVLIGGKLAGAELAGTPVTYERLHRKILAPYIFDATVMRGGGEAAGEEEPSKAAAAGRFWLTAISSAPCELRRSVGLGRDLRFESQAVVGGGLENEGRIVYLSAFARSGLM